MPKMQRGVVTLAKDMTEKQLRYWWKQMHHVSRVPYDAKACVKLVEDMTLDKFVSYRYKRSRINRARRRLEASMRVLKEEGELSCWDEYKRRAEDTADNVTDNVEMSERLELDNKSVAS